MIKRELVRKLSKKVEMPQKEVMKIVDTLCEIVSDELTKGENVKMNGFGSFRRSTRAPKKGRNPLTGEQIEIPATNVVVFNPSNRLAEAVANAGKTGE